MILRICFDICFSKSLYCIHVIIIILEDMKMSTLPRDPMYKRKKMASIPSHVVRRLLEVDTALAHSVGFLETGSQRATWNLLPDLLI